MPNVVEVIKVEIKKELRWKKEPCKECPYKLGLIRTPVNPCLQCKMNGYSSFETFKKQLSSQMR